MTTTNNITTFTVNMNIYNNSDQTINYNVYFPTKACNTCRIIKQLIEFHKKQTSHDGHKSQCKTCCSNYKKEYYEKNKDSIIKNNKQYKENNKDKMNNWEKEYYQKNKEKILNNNKKYNEINKNKLIEHKKEYSNENK